MIVIGLGSNMPFEGRSPVQNMERALDLLAEAPGIQLMARSPFYVSAPVGKVDQPDFYNGVAALTTMMAPLDLMKLLLGIEKQFGRVRQERWGPRTLDLDLIDFKGEILNISEGKVTLHLPHPRMRERAFVLRPLDDIAPWWLYPGTEKTAEMLLNGIEPEQIIQKVPVDAQVDTSSGGGVP